MTSVIPNVVYPNNADNKKPQIVAMVHVHSTTVLTNTAYTKGFGLTPLTPSDFGLIRGIVEECEALWRSKLKDTFPFIADGDATMRCRSAVFLEVPSVQDKICNVFDRIPCFKRIAQRALREVDIFTRNGINIVEVENVGAPYFIGNVCPWEELMLLLYVCKRVRSRYPTLVMGTHILSCDELEALPIGLACGAYFIRSEATLFGGVRPEGPTANSGNLARYFYVRNMLRLKHGGNSGDAHYPTLWSDVQKKHTVFMKELHGIDTWLSNVLFCKMEGVIITGIHTGSDAREEDLRRTREAIDKAAVDSEKIFMGVAPGVRVPLITGSGTNLEMYAQYADFIIVGTLLKKGKYWENDVDEANVKDVVKRVNETYRVGQNKSKL